MGRAFRRDGPFAGVFTKMIKGKRVAGIAPCETKDCPEDVHIKIGGDNWTTWTCSGCGASMHGPGLLRAKHELDRLTASDKVASVDTLPQAYSALAALQNAPQPEPTDQLTFVTASPPQSKPTAHDHKLPEAEEPIHEADAPSPSPDKGDEDESQELDPFEELAR